MPIEANVDERFTGWLAAAEQRYLTDLTRAELGRALRALGSCYVERRDRLGEGRALDSRGKRAAFALYYAPLHFLMVRAIAVALTQARTGPTTNGHSREAAARPAGPARMPASIVDVGCGTGAAGAAWALVTGGAVDGFDVSAWAVQEAAWTYQVLGVRGRARRADVAAVPVPGRPATILAAYTVNELSPQARDTLLDRLVSAATKGHRMVIIEPIAKGLTPWWRQWERAIEPLGGRAREWRVAVQLPALLRELDKSAGLSHRELTAKTLST